MSTTTRTVSLDRGDLPTVVASVLLVNVVGAAPAVLAGPDSAWFQALDKPAIYPPPWVFGVVWTTLFTLLGVALAIVWLSGTDRRPVRIALGLFVLQMVFNVAWTPAFFALEDLLLGLVVIVSLWPLVVATLVAFARVDRRAGALVAPYLLWVTFAAVLNYQFLALN
ncbi:MULTISPECIES: TspO/MBR family protein [Salinibaculum]|uniref:TspO/MBR family protein n=1 Tax=Salinibaculum TaxID=2732368 RepID=UPI0030D07641